MSKITRIRVPSTFASTDDTGYRFEIADFKLGTGPCGKAVVDLQLRPEDHGFEVVQETADGEVKTFIYPTAQLTGRIEVTCGKYLGDDIPGNPSLENVADFAFFGIYGGETSGD